MAKMQRRWALPPLSNVLLVGVLAFVSTGIIGCDWGSGNSTTTQSTTAAPAPSPSPAPAPAPPTSPAPTTQPPTPLPSTTSELPAACLCVFDIDRTLTGRQSETAQCPGNLIQAGVPDTAYSGGILTLSKLSQALEQTFCSSCYIATISAGDASGPGSKERQVLHERLGVVPGKLPTTEWSNCNPVTSPLVIDCPDGSKQNSVPGIIEWYRLHASVQIADADVHFFDDRASNVLPFQKTQYNAHQIACARRDLNGAIGLCGATLEEIKLERGVYVCKPGEDYTVQVPYTSGIFPV